LRGDLLDLSDGGADRAGLGFVLCGPADHAVELAAERQQQRSVFTQRIGQAGFQAVQAIGEGAEQGELLTDRHLVGQDLLESRHQPADRGSAGARLAGMQGVPMFGTEAMDGLEAGMQPAEGLALVQTPGEPGCNAKVLRLGLEQKLAAAANLLPVDHRGCMHGRRLGQLMLEQLELAAVTYVVAREARLADRASNQLKIMFAQRRRKGHP